MGDYPVRVTIEEGCDRILERIIIVGMEYVPVEDCDGRILAEDILAKENIPPFPRSPYDGYAFRACDTKGADKEHPVTFTIVEELPAGKAPTKTINKNEAAKILTGAPVPEGADVIEAFEHTEFTESEVTVFKEYKPDTNIVPVGEDVKIGQKLLEKGMLLTPSDVGLLAGLGFAEVPVYKKPTAALISTGSELMPPGTELPMGKIRNSSAYALKGYLEKAGAQVHLSGIVKDESAAIAERIRKEAEEADVIVTTGGVSVGDYDMVLSALDLLGAEILFWKLEMKPGMAFVGAVYKDKLILALSGNPSSAAISMFLVGLPGIRKMTGRTDYRTEEILVTLQESFPKSSPARRLIPGKLKIVNGEAHIDMKPRQGNGMLHPLHGCDVLAELPAGSPPVKAGEKVRGYLIF